MNKQTQTVKQPINSVYRSTHVMRYSGSYHFKKVIFKFEFLILYDRCYSMKKYKLQLFALENYVLAFKAYNF